MSTPHFITAPHIKKNPEKFHFIRPPTIRYIRVLRWWYRCPQYFSEDKVEDWVHICKLVDETEMVILTAQNCRINITNAFTNAELTFVNFHENPRKHIGGPRFRLIRRGTRDAGRGTFFRPPPLRPLNITTSEASDPGDGWGARSR